MADYTELKKQAQEIFTEMLSVCEEKIENFNSCKVDPILYFEEEVKRLGSCEYCEPDQRKEYDYKIFLSKIVLPAGGRMQKHVIAHELSHAISTKRGHGKEFKQAVRLIDKIFGTSCSRPTAIDFMIISEGLYEFDKNLYGKYSDYCKKQEEKRLKRERKKQERLKEENERIRQLQIKYFGHELGNIPKS